MHEVSAPEGYLKVTDIHFTVDKDGRITVIKYDEEDTVKQIENKLIVTNETEPKERNRGKILKLPNNKNNGQTGIPDESKEWK